MCRLSMLMLPIPNALYTVDLTTKRTVNGEKIIEKYSLFVSSITVITDVRPTFP